LIEFKDDKDRLSKFVEWGLATKTAKKPKDTFLYKGLQTERETPCTIIGYVSNIEVIIQLNGTVQLHIHPKWLKEMQKKDFSIRSNADDE
jgi:hypothetical protein